MKTMNNNYLYKILRIKNIVFAVEMKMKIYLLDKLKLDNQIENINNNNNFNENK